MGGTDDDFVKWRLWDGDEVVLELTHRLASHFHTIEWTGAGMPRLRRYQATRWDPDARIVDAELVTGRWTR